MEDLKPSSAPTPAAANNSDLSDCGRATIQALFSDFGKRKCDRITSPLKSLNSPSSHDSPMKTVATPATNAMTTAKWLQTVICSLPPKPSPELERFLSSCDRDVASGITRRVNIILEAIFTSNNLQCASMMDSMWVEQRKLEALKLYYRVLQTVCMAESQILNVHNLTSLLTHERLHRCMLACSAELVLVTHKTVTMPFPAVIESIGITSFDLSKVIESFIRHEESLPRELRRHLNSLEEQLLESTVWEKGSSMYNSLAVARPALSSEINRLGLLAKPMPSLDEISMHTDASCRSVPCIPSVQKLETLTGKQGGIPSPKKLRTGNRSILVERSPFNSPLKDRLLACNNVKSKPLSPALPSAVASPTRQNPEGGGEMCAETAINVFFNKVAKLAAVRIKGMVERLKLSQQTRESVYRLFQQILSQRTILFFNRHVDQIILCCFYLVAKISKVKLTFSDIISHYKKQPFCKPRVPHSVFVDWSSAGRPGKSGQEHVGIMTFYNEIFLISVRPLLLELEPDGLVQNPSLNSETKNSSNGHPGSPKLSPFPKLPDMSPRKVSAVHNVYVSPLRATKRDALISNGLKSYYACIGESTHAYRSPSKDLSAINNHLNGNRKARGMLNFDDVGGGFGLVSDFMVANSISLRNGSCASSSPGPTVKSEQVDS